MHDLVTEHLEIWESIQALELFSASAETISCAFSCFLNFPRAE